MIPSFVIHVVNIKTKYIVKEGKKGLLCAQQIKQVWNI